MMLQKIRDKITGWFAGVVIALLAGAFILWGVEFYFQQSTSHQNSVATVNDVVVTQDQVNQLVSRMQSQLVSQLGPQVNTPTLMQELKEYAVQSLVTETALLTTFTNEGFRISMTQIKAFIEQTPQFQARGKFSEEKLLQSLYQMQMSPSQFFTQVQSRWIVNQVMQSVSQSSFALPNEVNHWVFLQNQKRAFGYLIVPTEAFLSNVSVSAQAVKNDYDANQTTYKTPAQVSVSYLILSPAVLAKSITVTEADAKAYYQSHMINAGVKSPPFHSIKEKVISLLTHKRVNELLSKQSNQLADLTYTNPNTLVVASLALHLPIQTSPLMTKSGEKSGIFSNSKILAAIFSDSVYQSGNNSDVIGLPDGTQLVLRIAKKVPSTVIPFDQVQAQIQKKLEEKQATARAGVLAYQLQTKLEQGLNPEALAKQYHLTWETASLMMRNQKSSVPAPIIAAAFSTPLKHAQAISYDQNDFAVVFVSQVEHVDPNTISSADKQKIASQVSNLWAQMLQRCFVNSVMKHAKIVMQQSS